MYKKIGILIIVCVLNLNAMAQQIIVLDKITGVVGNTTILLSEIKFQTEQLKMQGTPRTECEIFEEFLFQKMLYTQGVLDSVEVTDKQVEGELGRRISYYIQQFGGEEELEKFYGKNISRIKEDFREEIREQLVAQQVQSKIAGDVKVSPDEVRKFYNTIPKDSLPFINSQIELSHLVIQPPISTEEKEKLKEKLNKLRERILKGEDFGALAVAYSEDPGTAAKAGEVGFIGKGQLVPEFEAAAFDLKGKDVSRVVETDFGFHILQLIDRRGELINVRHILLVPKLSSADLYKASQKMDSLYKVMSAQLLADTLKFTNYVAKYSDERESKYNGGSVVNEQNGTFKFENTEIDQQLFFAIDKLKIGEITKPMPHKTIDGKNAYRIVQLKNRTEPHKVNLKEDYLRLQNQAIASKQQKLIKNWIKDANDRLYIKLNAPYDACELKYNIKQHTN